MLVSKFSTDPTRQTDAAPTRIVADARLMGRGPFHVDIALPLLANNFSMSYSGRLGAMPATAFTPFLLGATKLGFSNGEVESISFTARVRNGFASGTVVPRWKGLKVEVPGIAKTGPLGGIRRAIAKFAANEFMVNADNSASAKRPPEDGVIRHQWTPRQSLPQFLWFSIRDAILPILQQ